MSEETFWQLIGLLGFAETEFPGDDDEDETAIAPLVDALSVRSPEEIDAFYEILAHKLHAIDTKQHMLKYDWPSDDGFLYARCWVVARGEGFYTQVLNDPAAMPRIVPEGREDEFLSLPSPSFEPLLAAAPKAYEQKTGKEFHYTTAVSIETGSNTEGWSDA